MLGVVRAIICEEDFEAFRLILGTHLPTSYDEWLKLSNYENDQIMKVPGRHIVRKEVNPDSFLAWCATPTGENTLSGLHRFAGTLERDAN